jgi:hypothetical protein
MGLAPVPALGPEKFRGAAYETDVAQNDRRRGPLRFEEGIATDTDVPNEFRRGAYADTANERPVTAWKHSAETQRERVHMGSSTWIDAPPLLGEFAHGAQMFGHGFEREMGANTIQRRQNRAVVTD